MIKSKTDIFRLLARLDQQLSNKTTKKIKFIIIGGAAFLILREHRVTEDIDIILLDSLKKEEIQVLADFNINNQAQGIIEFPPKEDLIEGMYRLDIEFKYLEVYLPDPIHLVLSKIFSSRMDERDLLDITESGILDNIDFNRLEYLYKEYLAYNCNLKYWDIEEIKGKYLKFKNKGW